MHEVGGTAAFEWAGEEGTPVGGTREKLGSCNHSEAPNPHPWVSDHLHTFQGSDSSQWGEKMGNTQGEEERTTETVAFLPSENWVRNKPTMAGAHTWEHLLF